MKIQELINGEVIEREMTEQELVEMEFQRKKFDDNQKLFKLTNWFDKVYPKYEQMFNRRHFLAIEDVIVDEFRGKTYHNLGELYREGEDVAREIRELKESLKN